MIEHPDDDALADLCDRLKQRADTLDRSGEFPTEQLRMCGEAGVFRWFLPESHGGFAWDDRSVVAGYLALAEACLTTTFVVTQRTGACRRLAGGRNTELAERLLPALAAGDAFATVGISHLTTSRRHWKKPSLVARRVEQGYVFDGVAPWVTGGAHAQHIVTGAAVLDGEEPTPQQILAAVPTDSAGVRVDPHFELVALTASSTGAVQFDGVQVDDAMIVDWPAENVMSAGAGGNTGGHETSTLALGLAGAAIGFLARETSARDSLLGPTHALAAEREALVDDLMAIAGGEPACTKEELRQRANSLALRATQAALAGAKGAGYVAGHPVGRWCREALFFLVWSCPQPVAEANLCELAGLE